MVYFDKTGKDNTERTLQIAKEEATKRNIKHVVVASTTGNTGLQAAQIFQNTDIKLVVVAHSTGYKEVGKQYMDNDKMNQIKNLGAEVFIGTDTLNGFIHAMRDKGRFSELSIIADTLRMFSQGMKVCVEIVAMAYDANLIPMEDVIVVAGTGVGADTTAVIGANSTNEFFNIKIKEILAKPKSF